MRVTAQQYAIALEELASRGLKEEYYVMLRTHWAAPRRAISMSELARAAGYSDHKFGNLRYGSLAKRIAKYANIRIPQDWVALYAIATWSAEPWNVRGHFVFTMRPQLAAALEQLGLTHGATPPEEFDDPLDVLEGAAWTSMKLHRTRERRLRTAKIAAALALASDGHLRCEVPKCGFDFERVYGSTGAGYVQVHHLVPLSSRVKPEHTRLEDLVIVCANCHAMIHRFGASRAIDTLIPRRRAV